MDNGMNGRELRDIEREKKEIKKEYNDRGGGKKGKQEGRKAQILKHCHSQYNNNNTKNIQ